MQVPACCLLNLRKEHPNALVVWLAIFYLKECVSYAKISDIGLGDGFPP